MKHFPGLPVHEIRAGLTFYNYYDVHPLITLLNEAALEYMQAEKLPCQPLTIIEQSNHTIFDIKKAWLIP